MKLEKNDSEIILQNSAIQITFSITGRAKKLIFNNKNLIAHLDGNIVDPDRHHSFYLDYHQDLQSKAPQYNRVTIVENTDCCKHIAFIDDHSNLALEYHIIMRSETSKLYSYVIAKSNTTHPFTINEMRTVYRVDKQLFPYSYTNARRGLQPSSNYTNQYERLQDETYKMPDGELFSNSKIYSKYDYADYFSTNPFWGFYGQEFGLWFVPISTDYYPSGPLKQELMVHYDGILLNYLSGAHFGTSDFIIEPGWEKCYGPWCIYLNAGEHKVADVKQFTKQEQTEWPFIWMNEKLYPQKRSVVSGRVELASGAKDKMKVILSQGTENFAKTSGGYIYYTDSDEQGNFTFKHVRYGNYTLSAFTLQGENIGEFTHDISVQDKNEQLGTLFWSLSPTKTLWQIGTANHTTYPFKFSDQLRNTIWRDLTPANLHFYINQSAAETDWYCIQSYRGTWQIHFSYHNSSTKQLYLKIALAGASKRNADHENDRGHNDPELSVALNGEALGKKQFLDDNAVYRNALLNGSYHTWLLPLDTKLLTTENIISLSTNGYMMYDTLLLVESKTN